MSPTRDESQILMKIIIPERFRSFVAAQRNEDKFTARSTDKAYLGTPPSGYRFHHVTGGTKKIFTIDSVLHCSTYLRIRPDLVFTRFLNSLFFSDETTNYKSYLS